MGTPEIVTNTGAQPEIFEDGISGLFVQPRDPNSLVAVILQILSCQKLSKRLIGNGLARVKKYFSMQLHVDAIQSLYTSILYAGL